LVVRLVFAVLLVVLLTGLLRVTSGIGNAAYFGLDQ